jgi:hypothetical protein
MSLNDERKTSSRAEQSRKVKKRSDRERARETDKETDKQ